MPLGWTLHVQAKPNSKLSTEELKFISTLNEDLGK